MVKKGAFKAEGSLGEICGFDTGRKVETVDNSGPSSPFDAQVSLFNSGSMRGDACVYGEVTAVFDECEKVSVNPKVVAAYGDDTCGDCDSDRALAKCDDVGTQMN